MYIKYVYVRMAQELTVSVRYSPFFNAPLPRSISVVTLLPLSHNSMCHVGSRSSSCLEKKELLWCEYFYECSILLAISRAKGSQNSI
jgi:hypothetical protein